jgi:hypothetical protein
MYKNKKKLKILWVYDIIGSNVKYSIMSKANLLKNKDAKLRI